MKLHTIVRPARVGSLAAGMVAAALLSASPALASAQTGDAAGFPFDLGPSPVGVGSCPFANGDANFVYLSGHSVQHGSSNKNGDWGGGTLEGTAQFYEGTTPLYVGHLTIWQGGGNNSTGQSEGGLTINFTGTGAGGSLSIHANVHMTTNAAGTPTASVANISVSCS